jgi:acetyltransferase-like isoleucine patch superfamily enzyme
MNSYAQKAQELVKKAVSAFKKDPISYEIYQSSVSAALVFELRDATAIEAVKGLGVNIVGPVGSNNVVLLQGFSGQAEVHFHGSSNNVVFLGPYSQFNGRLSFEGDNHYAVFGGSIKKHNFINAVFHGHGAGLFIGKDCQILDMKCFIEGGSTIEMGENCLVASKVQLRTTDSHGIFDLDSRERVNHAASITIGSRVWMAEDVLIFGNTMIGYGSAIGARSVASKKRIENFSLAVGVPIRVVRKNITWTQELFPSQERLTETFEAADRIRSLYPDEPVQLSEIQENVKEPKNKPPSLLKSFWKK